VLKVDWIFCKQKKNTDNAIGIVFFLEYKKEKPAFLAPHLIRSGQYFVQQFVDQGRLYLRIEQPLGHR
jgi:hypothetical protein